MALSAVVIGISAGLLAMEITLRFLPVFVGVFLQPVTKDFPVARMEPNRPLTYSVGWSMARSNQNHVNNDGFVHDHDYRIDNKRTTTAIIGDSYVEALMLPHAETLQGLLGAAVGAKGDAYSFGISGASMSQYLVWAQYAREHYKAKALIFVIVATDFDESLVKYRARTGFHYFDGDLERCDMGLIRLDHYPNPLRPLLRNSALLQYLVFNLGLLEGEQRQAWLRSVVEGNTKDTVGEGQIDEPITRKRRAVEPPNNRLADSKCSVRTFFRLLPEMTGFGPDRVLFVLDGLKAYTDEARVVAEKGYFSLMRQYFLTEAADRGYGVIDADPSFKKRRQENNDVFEMPQDVHWNADAHALIAEQVKDSTFFRNLFLLP
jgi:hypothetical protein